MFRSVETQNDSVVKAVCILLLYIFCPPFSVTCIQAAYWFPTILGQSDSEWSGTHPGKKTHTHFNKNSLSANPLTKTCGKFWDWSRMISTLVQPKDLLWSMAPRQSQVEEAMACCRRPGRRASSRYLWGASLMFVHMFLLFIFIHIHIDIYIYITYHVVYMYIFIWMIYLKKQGVS